MLSECHPTVFPVISYRALRQGQWSVRGQKKHLSIHIMDMLKKCCIPPDHLEVLAADRDTGVQRASMGWPSFTPITLLMPQNKQDRRHAASTSSSGPTCDICLQATQSTKEIENIKPTKIKHHTACKQQTNTRSQAVARIADSTASQHLWGSRDVIGHVTIDDGHVTI